METDTHFFTNENEISLADRLSTILSHDTIEFDVIVGYFYISGFYKIYKALDDVSSMKIIVGMGVDEAIATPFLSEAKEKQVRENLYEALKTEFEKSEDDLDIERGVEKFIEFIENKKLEIKAHPSKKLHAKVYVMLKKKGSEDFGKVITGSSNLTASGLEGNLEFNVELKDKPDVEFAKNKFDELWKESIPVEDLYIDVIRNHSYLKPFTPYEIYLKTLFEYFRDLFTGPIEELEAPEGYVNYKFQEDAVKLAVAKIEQHGGLMLSDVVGLGKTYIAARIAQTMHARPLVVCPPHLKSYWEDVLASFGVVSKVVSSGNLDKVVEELDKYKKYNIVFVDESHTFRNSETKGYGYLHEICAGKKVVLISATPLNNAPMDIANQLFLFEPKYSSTLPYISNLNAFFSKLQDKYESTKAKSKSNDSIDRDKIKDISNEIRDKVLKSLMIRRTRKDVEKYYSSDMKTLGLQFPTVQDPITVYYELDKELNDLFDRSVRIIEMASSGQSLKYAKYRPFNYLKDEGETYLFEKGYVKSILEVEQMKRSERLLIGLMRTLLLKRLDSSFEAYKNTLDKIIKSYDAYIRMFDDGKVVISKGVDVVDIWNRGEIDDLIEDIEQGEKNGYYIPAAYFKKDFRENLVRDFNILNELKSLWDQHPEDPKIDALIHYLNTDKVLTTEKVIIFTEFEDTAEYIYEHLPKNLKDEAVQISSKSDPKKAKEAIECFDPLYRNKFQNGERKDYRILITTEVLAEGLNLNLSRVVINYDIPWNPTRVIQRFGRINRIGTKGNLYIYNFFPTKKTEEKIHLKNYAVQKIELFINTLGTDSKYLTEEESVNPAGLFEKINSKELYTEEEETDEELKYFIEIKNLLGKDGNLKKKLEEIPAKARTGRLGKDSSLLTYFKIGAENKFILSDGGSTNEIAPLDAFKMLSATPDEHGLKVSDAFYEYLKKNKACFELLLNSKDSINFTGKEGELVKIVKFLEKDESLSKFDKNYLLNLEDALRYGVISKSHINDAKKKFKRNASSKEQVNLLKASISPKYVEDRLSSQLKKKEKKIIISEEFIQGEKNE